MNIQGVHTLLSCAELKQAGWALQVSNRVRNSKYALSNKYILRLGQYEHRFTLQKLKKCSTRLSKKYLLGTYWYILVWPGY